MNSNRIKGNRFCSLKTVNRARRSKRQRCCCWQNRISKLMMTSIKPLYPRKYWSLLNWSRNSSRSLWIDQFRCFNYHFEESIFDPLPNTNKQFFASYSLICIIRLIWFLAPYVPLFKALQFSPLKKRFWLSFVIKNEPYYHIRVFCE